MSNLIELPGMRGKISISYDMSRADVQLDLGGCDLRTAVQILLLAVQGAVGQWIQIDNGIIRPKGATQDDNQETNSEKKNDNKRCAKDEDYNE